MSATLRRIFRPITFRPKGAGTSGRSADSTEYEGFREAPSPLSPAPIAATPEATAGRDANGSEPIPSTGSNPVPATVNPDEIGLTRVILEMRKRTIENGSGEITALYESSARDQKSGAKLPKGSMVDRKVG